MRLNVSRTDTWAATIDDRPGGLADKLAALAAAGANLEFIIARRAPEQRGSGVVFVTPLKGAKQARAAEAAGFQKTESLHSLRVEGTDKPGTGVKLAKALAEFLFDDPARRRLCVEHDVQIGVVRPHLRAGVLGGDLRRDGDAPGYAMGLRV